MRPAAFRLIVLCALTGSAGAILWPQWKANAAARGEIRGLRLKQQHIAPLQEENRRLVAQQVTPEELEGLRKRHAGHELLRAMVEQLRRQAQALPTASATARPAVKPSEVEMVPVRAFKNAGMATPETAFESLVWAVTQGDTSTIAKVISFDQKGRGRAEALFARLPRGEQAHYATPEGFFATLVAARVPSDLSAIGSMGQYESGPESVAIRTRLGYAGERVKDKTYIFKRGPSGWRLLVPASVVEHYERSLSEKPRAGN